MALERKNPLPVNRYWIDTFGDNRAKFTTWLRLHKGDVKSRVTESQPSTDPPREWHMFDVINPVWFDQESFGFPTIADPSVQTSQDTVSRPDPELDLPDKIPTELPAVTGGIGLLALIIAGAFLYMQSKDRR